MYPFFGWCLIDETSARACSEPMCTVYSGSTRACGVGHGKVSGLGAGPIVSIVSGMVRDLV